MAGKATNKLMAVIGDEVKTQLASRTSLSLVFFLYQDTCTGFLLGGIGEYNSKRQPNFLIVNKGLPFFVQSLILINPPII